MKRKWLKVLLLAMMAGVSFGSAMNPKEIEDLMDIMNQTRIEFTVPDEDDNGDGGKTGTHQKDHESSLPNSGTNRTRRRLAQGCEATAKRRGSVLDYHLVSRQKLVLQFEAACAGTGEIFVKRRRQPEASRVKTSV